VPSNEVTFQSLGVPAIGVATTGLAGSGRWHVVRAASLVVVLVPEAWPADEHAARTRATTAVDITTTARR
jgi:hypothetical protein